MKKTLLLSLCVSLAVVPSVNATSLSTVTNASLAIAGFMTLVHGMEQLKKSYQTYKEYKAMDTTKRTYKAEKMLGEDIIAIAGLEMPALMCTGTLALLTSGTFVTSDEHMISVGKTGSLACAGIMTAATATLCVINRKAIKNSIKQKIEKVRQYLDI